MKRAFSRAQRGDAAAVAVVVDRLTPRMTRMAAYYGRRSSENSEDLLQEAWIGLLEALRELDLAIGSPDQYLLKHARWRLLDAVRRTELRRCLALDQAVSDLLPDSHVTDVLSDVLLGEFARQLKPAQTEILECLLMGMTWRETGEIVGCSSANVAYHVRQIQQRYAQWDESCRCV